MKTVVDYCTENNIKREVILDIGCAMGQSTYQWEQHFERCIGLDSSEHLIAVCQNKLYEEECEVEYKGHEDVHTNVAFIQGNAERLPFPDNSIDVVSCGSTWNWMNQKAIIPEIKRVLRKPGCFAVYGYSITKFLPTLPEARKHYLRFVQKKIVPRLPEHAVAQCENAYTTTPLPFPEDRRYEFPFVETITFIKMQAFYCGLHTYFCNDPEGKLILDMLMREMDDILPPQDERRVPKKVIEMERQTFLVLCKKTQFT